MSALLCRLETLLAGVQYTGDVSNLEISSISVDSRGILKGGLFIALKGERIDARKFIPGVLEQGAVAVLTEDENLPFELADRHAQRVIRVKNLSLALSKIAGRFYQHPSRKLKVIGITGTNGKTSIAWYLAQVLEMLGLPAGMVGTLGVGRVSPVSKGESALGVTGLTTPDAVQMQQRLFEMHSEGVDVVCMEVSSHALELGRVADVSFDTVVYSNLSQDHLDFHQTMERYAAAKQRLFEDFEFNHAVVNSDDDLGQEILQKMGFRGLSYGIHSGELRAFDIARSAEGLQFSVSENGEKLRLNTSMIGVFNVYNMLAVIAVARSLGYALRELGSTIESCRPVPGRMERVDTLDGQPVVIVDYAHTPDALDKALQACRSHCTGSLSVVFGCGGDRDRVKRSEMGLVAERLADQVYVTDDNPRSESPAGIAVEIMGGMSQAAWLVHDRATAIGAAVAQARPGDWVLVAGKGHESKQFYANRVIDFQDNVVAGQVLARLAA